MRPVLPLILLSAIASGCAGLPATVPSSELSGYASLRPDCCCDNVHVFVLESPFDVLHFAGIPKLARAIEDMGFENVHYHDYYVDGNGEAVADRIRAVKSENPHSRVMLVGYSIATLAVEDAIASVERDGIWIDSAVYIDSFWYRKIRTGPRPQNCQHSLLLYRGGTLIPQGHPAVSVVGVDERNHLRVPLNKGSYETIVGEALRLTQSGCPCACHLQPLSESLPEPEATSESVSQDESLSEPEAAPAVEISGPVAELLDEEFKTE